HERNETLATLKYASLTRNIKNLPKRNVKNTNVGSSRRDSLTRETASSSARRNSVTRGAGTGNDRKSSTPANGHSRKKSVDPKQSNNHDEPGWYDMKNLQSMVIRLRAENNALRVALVTVENRTSVSGRTPGRSTPTLTSSGRNTPTKPRRPMSPLATFSTPKNSLSHQNQEHLEEIEHQYLQLRQSYAELSLKYGQTSAELALYQDNRELASAYPVTPLGTLLSGSHDGERNFTSVAEPIIREYEKSIALLEEKLVITQAELDHSEQMLKEHVEALEEAERTHEHNLNTAASLQKYIVELETKLEKRESEAMTREVRNEHPEKFISETVRLLEQRLQESE
ncbi:7186_t:CDS:1, partial [Acaulospora colombiana]